MKKVLRAILCATLILTVVVTPVLGALAGSANFRTSGEHFSNGIEQRSLATKSNDGDKSFYVTIEGVWVLDAADKIYFGPRMKTKDGYSGALNNGLGYSLSKNPRQKARYTKNAPGGFQYALNVKQSTDGPGNHFLLDVKWTP